MSSAVFRKQNIGEVDGPVPFSASKSQMFWNMQLPKDVVHRVIDRRGLLAVSFGVEVTKMLQSEDIRWIQVGKLLDFIATRTSTRYILAPEPGLLRQKLSENAVGNCHYASQRNQSSNFGSISETRISKKIQPAVSVGEAILVSVLKEKQGPSSVLHVLSIRDSSLSDLIVKLRNSIDFCRPFAPPPKPQPQRHLQTRPSTSRYRLVSVLSAPELRLPIADMLKAYTDVIAHDMMSCQLSLVTSLRHQL